MNKDTKPTKTADTISSAEEIEPAQAAIEQKPERKLNVYQKIAAITGEIGAIAKGGKNTEQGYAFIEYAAVAGELRGLFAKYGVVITPDMQKAAEQMRETFTTKRGGQGVAALIDFKFDIINADAPDDRFTVNWVGEATDYGDKATNKAATAALKYYLMRQFNVSEKGEAEADHTTIEKAGSYPPEPTYNRPAPAPAPSAPQLITDGQKKLISEALSAKGVNGAYQKLLITHMSKQDDISKITSTNAQTLLERLKAADENALIAYLAELPTPEPEPVDPADATDVDEPKIAGEEVPLPPPATPEPTVDDGYKTTVTKALNSLNIDTVSRMRLLKDSTGAISDKQLSDDQWRAFSEAIDEYAINQADKITAMDNNKQGGGNVKDTEQTA